jgi:putative PIN family toxin of toxin-antitoxin system
MSHRVIFGTSTLVSAALRIGSIPHQALLEALSTCDLCASAETLVELERVLDLEKFDRYLDRGLRRQFVALIRRSVHLFVVKEDDLETVDLPCRGSKDNQFLALALVSEADILVSSDENFLLLHPWRRVAIISPGEFLSCSNTLPEVTTEARVGVAEEQKNLRSPKD